MKCREGGTRTQMDMGIGQARERTRDWTGENKSENAVHTAYIVRSKAKSMTEGTDRTDWTDRTGRTYRLTYRHSEQVKSQREKEVLRKMRQIYKSVNTTREADGEEEDGK